MRICWPNPDATCLEGGCIHCQHGKEVSMAKVSAWAATAGQVKNRGNDKTKDALIALGYRTDMR